MDRATELELIAKAEEGCSKAEAELLAANYKTIRGIANKVIRSGAIVIGLEDAVQEGCLEFIKTLRKKKFDKDAGFRFMTFASRGIKQSMNRAAGRQHGQCAVPSWVVDLITSRYYEEGRYMTRYGKEPTKEYINTRHPASSKAMSDVVDFTRGMRSLRLDSPLPLDDTRHSLFHEYIADKSSDVSFDQALTNQQRARLTRCLDRLEERERNLLGNIFSDEITFQEVANNWGVSKQRVHQIYKVALDKVKHLMLKTPELIDLEAPA